MIVVEGARAPLRTLQCWFPADATGAAALLARAPLVDVMQCAPRVAADLAPLAWRTREFRTLLVDLSLDEAALWQRLEKRTCRYQLRRAEKLAPELRHLAAGAQDAALEAQARALIDGFIGRKRFRPALGAREWARLRRDADLYVALHGGQAIATHLVLVDGLRRARALVSATVDRGDGEGRALAGSLNRWLHWREFGHLRQRGVAWYDFGGLFGDPDHPDAAIDQFKLMFGGEQVVERVVRLCRWRPLRAALRAVVEARGGATPREEATRGAG